MLTLHNGFQLSTTAVLTACQSQRAMPLRATPGLCWFKMTTDKGRGSLTVTVERGEPEKIPNLAVLKRNRRHMQKIHVPMTHTDLGVPQPALTGLFPGKDSILMSN